MKKISKYTFLLSTVLLVACGTGNVGSEGDSYTSNEEVSSETVVSLYDDSPLGDREFRVRVLYSDGTPCYSEGMRAQWCSPVNCYMPVKFDANGYGRTTIAEDGYDEYVIHLMKLPEGFTYNPNAYVATSTNRDIEITLIEVGEEQVENVNLQSGENVINAELHIISEGVFTGSIDSNGGRFLFGFNPSLPGKYKIESWAYDFAGITAKLNYHSGSHHYIPAEPLETYEGGGLSGNFAYELNCPSTAFVTDENGENPQSGATHIFSITVEGTGLIYPFEFAFSISRVGDATEPIKQEPVETIDVYASETLTPFSDEKPTGTVLAPIPLDGSKICYYNETDRFYHLDSVDGPLVLVALKRQNPYISPGIAEIHTAAYGDSEYLVTDNNTKNYEPMIMAYAENCNSSGVYPATEELKTFIEYLIVEHDYFAPKYGFITTALDYEVAEENQWLYACYYYRSLV